MKHLIASAFFIAALNIYSEEADSIAILNSDFTLGRVTGGNIAQNAAILQPFHEAFVVADMLHYQTGKESCFNIGVSPMGMIIAAGDADNGGLLLLPEADLLLGLGSGCRLSATLSSPNLLTGYGGNETISGFDIPFTMLGIYDLAFMSGGGSIAVPSEQRDIAFLFGPQLNLGQLSLNTSVVHAFGDLGGLTRIFSITSIPAIGIQNNFQLGATIHYARDDKEHWTSSSFTTQDTSFKFVVDKSVPSPSQPYDDSLNLGLVATIHTPSILAHASSAYVRGIKARDSYREVQFAASAAYLFGKRITNSRQLLGNFDRFFSSTLGKGQFLGEAGIDYTVYNMSSANSFTFQEQFSSGLLKYLTVGEQYSLRTNSWSNAINDLSINATLCNIPLREKGPSEVSTFEYTFGSVLKKGECKATFGISILKQASLSAYYPRPIYELMIDSSLVSPINFPGSIGSLLNNTVQSNRYGLNNRSMLPKNGVNFFNITAGITDRTKLTNNFSYSVNHFSYMGNSPNNSTLTFIDKNFIYTDQLAFSFLFFRQVMTEKDDFGISDQHILTSSLAANKMLSFIINVFGQSDKNMSGSDKVLFSFAMLFQAGL